MGGMQSESDSSKNKEDYDLMHLNKNIKFILDRHQLLDRISIINRYFLSSNECKDHKVGNICLCGKYTIQIKTNIKDK